MLHLDIGIIAPPWLAVPPVGYGGTEAVVDALARGYKRAGHNVMLHTVGDSTCDVVKTFSYTHGLTGRMGQTVPEFHHALEGYERLADCDVIHDHTIAGLFCAPQVTQRSRPGPGVFTTVHGQFDRESQTIYRAVAERVAIVAISHSQARSAGTIPIAGVVHHGVDVADFPAGRGDGGYLAVLARMHPDKGVHVAAELARELDLPLRIAAKMHSPDEFEYFETKVKPLLSDSVTYVGEIGGADKLQFLARARALLNPIAWAEPFGMNMIEALACGTPVIAGPFGAAPEIVDHGQTGFLCPSRSAYVRAIRHIYRIDRDRCRSVVAERFSVERQVDGYVRLFEAALAGPSLARSA